MTIPYVMRWQKAILGSELDSTTRHVALTLSTHMDAKGGSCHPSHALLATETKLNLSTIRRHLRLLKAGGWLTIQAEKGDLIGTRNHYSATLTTRPQETTGAEDTTGAERSSAEDTTGALDADHWAFNDATTRPESTSQEVSSEVSMKCPKNTSDFAEFWTAYPPRGKKPDAERAYRKAMKVTTHQAVMDGVKLWCEYWDLEGTELRFVPHGSSWLNAEQYNDRPPPLSRPQTGRRSAAADESAARLVDHLQQRPLRGIAQ